MPGKLVSTEDYISILNLMGTYQWLVDAGDEQGWADLFTEDGFFAGLPVTFRGREELKVIPREVAKYGGDKMRHLTGNYSMQYGETTGEAHVRFYSLVTTWLKDEGGKFFNLALCNAHLVRINGEWKIKSNSIKNLGE